MLVYCTCTECDMKKRTLVKSVEIGKALGTTGGNNTEREKEKSRKDAGSVFESALPLAGCRFSH